MRAVIPGLWILLAFVNPLMAQETADFFVEAYVDNPNPFIGQQISYTFRLYVRSGRTNLGSTIKPDFEGFWRQDYSKIVESTETHNGNIYRVRESRTILFPTQTGPITIEPSTFVIPRDAFGPGEVKITDAITLDVQSLPASDQLVSFVGLVGQFEFIQTLDRQTTTLGEPIRLQLTVRGTGNIEQVPTPDLVETEVWRVYANPGNYVPIETSDGRIVGEKTFEWLLTPTQAGQQITPDILLSYFDPASLQYQPVNLTPITIDVQGSEEDSQPLPSQIESNPALSLRPVPAILPVPDDAFTLVDALFIFLWVMPPILTWVIWWRVRRNRLRLQNIAYYRRTEALQQAQRRLATARRLTDRTAYQLVQITLMTYFADKLNLAAQSLHYGDIADSMRQRKIDTAIAQSVLQCLYTTDQALYAPSSEIDSSDLTAQAAHLLMALDANWGN